MPGPDTWIVAKAEREGMPHVLRIREGAPEFAEQAQFGQLLVVEWKYESQSAGMPAAEVLQRMDRFEELLLEQLEGERVAALVLIVTGGNARIWHWYIRNPAETMAAVNRALAGEEVFPVEFLRQDDPAWEAYLRVLRATPPSGE